MKTITEGHIYELRNFEDQNGHQSIAFINKKPIEGTMELETIHDGTTNEEVIEMLIDRLKYLHAKLPSKESACAITHLEEALMWLEKRTNDRKKRSVEGTHKP